MAEDLFSCLAAEMFAVGFRVATGMMDDAIAVIRQRVTRIELQWNIAGVYDVVPGAGRDDSCLASC